MNAEDLRYYYEERKKHGNATHGLSHTKEYSAWSHMHQRCESEKYKFFHQYGGRGIRVCERWKSFEVFLADVGYAPTKEHSIDRIDANGNYEPSNVRWSTWKTQERNRTNNRVIEINGEKKTLVEWCEIYGIEYGKVWQRVVRLGIDPVIALTHRELRISKKEKAEALAKAEMESHVKALERAELIAAGEA